MKIRHITLLGSCLAVFVSAATPPAALTDQELPGLWIPSAKTQPLPTQPPESLAGFEQTTGSLHGTAVHAVLVGEHGTTVAAFTGPVNISFANGHLPVQVAIGTQVVFGAKADFSLKTLAEIVAEEKANGTTSMVTTLMKGVQYMADTVSQTLVFNGEESAKVLATMVNTASTANPADAQAYVTIAVYGILKNPTLANTADGKAAVALVVNQAIAGAGPGSATAIIDGANNAGGQYTDNNNPPPNPTKDNPVTNNGSPITPLDPGLLTFPSAGSGNG